MHKRLEMACKTGLGSVQANSVILGDTVCALNPFGTTIIPCNWLNSHLILYSAYYKEMMA